MQQSPLLPGEDTPARVAFRGLLSALGYTCLTDPLPGIDSHTWAANTGQPVEALEGNGLLSVRLKRGRFLSIIGLRRG